MKIVLTALSEALIAGRSTSSLATGFRIRRNHWQRHVPCMIIALIASTGFLVGLHRLSPARRRENPPATPA